LTHINTAHSVPSDVEGAERLAHHLSRVERASVGALGFAHPAILVVATD
jgi:hypothetical protein